jgi:hypothetical protein
MRVQIKRVEAPLSVAEAEPREATCSCGSGIPVTRVQVNGRTVTLVALRPIMQMFRELGKPAHNGVGRELLDVLRIYNAIPPEEEPEYIAILEREYSAFLERGD